MDINSRLVRETVRDIKDKLLSRHIHFPESLSFSNTVDIPFDVFLRRWYNSISVVDVRMITLHKMALEESQTINMLCSSALILSTRFGTMGFMKNDKFYTFEDSEIFSELCADILEMKDCSIQPVVLTLELLKNDHKDRPANSAHVNILLIHKTVNNTYNIFLYEPNSYKYKNDISEIRDYFIVLLESYTEKVGINAKFFKPELTCPNGLQVHGHDKFGYCVMFSFFWYYNLISIIGNIEEKGNKKYDMSKIVNNIERNIINGYFPNELYETIRKFSLLWIERFYEEGVSIDTSERIQHQYDFFSRNISSENKSLRSLREESNRDIPFTSSPSRRWYQQDGEPCDEKNHCFWQLL